MRNLLVLFLLPVFALVSCGETKADVKPAVVTNIQENVLPKKEGSISIHLIKTISGHRNYVFYSDFSSDSRFLATGSADRTVRIWSTETWSNLIVITNFYDEVWGIPLHYSPDNQLLAIGAYENLVLLDAMRQYSNISSVLAQKKGIQSLYIAPDGKSVITAGVDGFLQVWRLPDLNLIQKVKAHASEVWNVCISPDGKYALSGGEDNLAKIWTYPQLEPVQSLKYHQMPIEYVRFSHDGKKFLVASADTTTSIWKFGEWKEPLVQCKGHLGSVLVATFSMDDRFLFSGGDDDTIYVFDVATGNMLEQLKEHYGDVMTLAVSPDGKYLVSGSRDRTIKVWELKYE